ncbi:Fusaric acid resistance protein-like [Geodermatophilus telluris]|uniref:Fusaric acid resistance protein-like n=1 Tax=Geodermatophilus telluris TaxID=1190417 RepID=A0A1G6MTR4_9ACTN|nr:FUSC family protein [Geodermatophilus telluris]SDC58634.1 Fusaric acid resistance protein-like [Geodermatophilus telluris]
MPVVRPLLGPPVPVLPALWQAGGRRGVTAAACLVAALAAGVAAGRPDLGSAAALASFTAVYGHALPHRRRAGVVAAVGAALVLSSTLGALTGRHPVVLVLTCAALVAAAAAAAVVWRVGPPGPLGVVLVAGGSSALGTAPGGLLPHALAAAAGAALAWAGCVLPWLWDPTGPERRALEAAEAAVRGGSPPAAAARAVRLADVAVRSGSRRDDGGLRDRLDDVEARFLAALPPAPPRPDPAPAAGAGVARWWHAPAAATALRLGAGAAAAGLAAVALGLTSPYWAVTTAVAVQLGTDARATRTRALQRAVGTAVGVLLAGLVVWLDLPPAAGIALAGLLQLAVELLVAAQYVLAVSCITPLALLLVHLGNPTTTAGGLVAERLAETAVGIVLALAVGLALLPRAASRRLPAAVREVAAAAAAGDDRRLHAALDHLAEVAAGARAELLPDPAVTAGVRRARAVADLGWGLLGARARGDAALAAELARRLTAGQPAS